VYHNGCSCSDADFNTAFSGEEKSTRGRRIVVCAKSLQHSEKITDDRVLVLCIIRTVEKTSLWRAKAKGKINLQILREVAKNQLSLEYK
jgi:hypothetical protein